MILRDVMQAPVHTVEISTTLVEAAQQMIQHGIGALVVTAPGGKKPQSIVTDRDLVKLISLGRDPHSATLADMVPPGAELTLVTASVEDEIRTVAKKMHMAGVRRIPLVDAGGNLEGIVSLDDLIVLIGREIRQASQELADLSAAVTTEFVHEHVVTSRLSALWGTRP